MPAYQNEAGRVLGAAEGSDLQRQLVKERWTLLDDAKPKAAPTPKAEPEPEPVTAEAEAGPEPEPEKKAPARRGPGRPKKEAS